MALSPDERRIVVDYPGSTELRMKVLGGSYVRLPHNGGLPWWSPDGSEIIFTADTSAATSYDLWSGSPDGVGDPRLVADLDRPVAHGAREPGGGAVIFRTAAQTPPDVLRIAVDGAMDTLLASETVSYFAPTLSPDGRFLAYVSSEWAPGEIYVRTYPALDRVWPISVGGGREPPVSRGDGPASDLIGQVVRSLCGRGIRTSCSTDRART